jgi:hypothetical protein
MNADDVITVYTLNDPNEAEVVKMLLRDHNIDCELDGEHQAGFSGIFEIGVLVRGEDADEAREVIRVHHLDDGSAD